GLGRCGPYYAGEAPFARRSLPYLVSVRRVAAILSAAAQRILGRASDLGRLGSRLPRHHAALPRDSGISDRRDYAAAVSARRMARRLYLRAASGGRRIRRLDFGTEEHSLRGFLPELGVLLSALR